MMFKWIGAILVFLGCGGFGFSMAFSYRQEEADLRRLIRALEFMRCELRYKLSPLPQLCRKASGCVDGCVGRVLLQLAEELEQQIAPDAGICMDVVLANTGGLSDSVIRQLHQLGQTLGQFDLDGQLRGIDACMESTQSLADGLARDKASRTRSYQTLGLCAGAALAILLI